MIIENYIFRMSNKLIKIGLLNFSVVALLGTILRYKIGFEFPYFDHKHLLFAHFYFAFCGWASHMFYILLKNEVNKKSIDSPWFNRLIYINLVSSYGILISYATLGIGRLSIFFSVVSILAGYLFAIVFIRKVWHLPSFIGKPWFISALLFNGISSFGFLYIANMMMTKTFDQNLYLGASYFYLHFQYSGWFFFAVIGLLLGKLEKLKSFRYVKRIFYLFFAACIPAYLLSLLWAGLPWYIYIFALIAVFLQLIALLLSFKILKTTIHEIKSTWKIETQYLFSIALIAISIKILLQLISVVPAVSDLAFGYRSIVIAYLHLVFLGFTTLSIFGFLVYHGYISTTKRNKIALASLCFGIIGNEVILMIQGLASLKYIVVPYVQPLLFVMSAIIFFSALTLFVTNIKMRGSD